MHATVGSLLVAEWGGLCLGRGPVDCCPDLGVGVVARGAVRSGAVMSCSVDDVWLASSPVYACKLSDREHPLYLRLVAGPRTDTLSFVLREHEIGEVSDSCFKLCRQPGPVSSLRSGDHCRGEGGERGCVCVSACQGGDVVLEIDGGFLCFWIVRNEPPVSLQYNSFINSTYCIGL